MGSFIKHADFIIKEAGLFFTEQSYIWRSPTSVPSPDGLLRLPFRLPFIGTNFLFGANITAYIFIMFVIVYSFASMRLFVTRFLKVESRYAGWLVPLIFALIPIYLGNFAKIGLQIGAASLPLMLVLAKKYIDTKSYAQIIWIILLVLMSIVHPFTFLINAVVVSLYLLNSLKELKLTHVLVGAASALGIASYALLPIASLGSVSRSQFDTESANDDFTGLVNIANTDSIYEGLTQAKTVLADFSFFSTGYRPIFIISTIGVFAFATLSLYRVKALDARHKKILAVSVAGLLVLLLLADVSTGNVQNALVALIKTPIGWAFRSPLKWQLYIPFALSIMLAYSLASARRQKLTAGILLLFFFGMNGFLAVNVYDNLLKPKSVTHFSQFAAEDTTDKRILFMRDFECGQYLTINSGINSELDYLVQTSGAQLRSASADTIANIDTTDYDYVINCTDHVFDGQDSWQLLEDLEPLSIYRTDNAASTIAATSNSVWFGDDFDVTNLQRIVDETQNDRVNITKDETAPFNGESYELFNNISSESFQDGKISSNIELVQEYQNISLLSSTDVDDEQILVNQNLIEVSEIVESQESEASQRSIPSSDLYNVLYSSAGFGFDNLVPNSSFEDGLWADNVSNCFRYDTQPQIGMDTSSNASDGTNALELSATRHLACTSTTVEGLNQGGSVFLSFKTNLLEGDRFRYVLEFDDPNSTIIERTVQVDDLQTWQEYTGFFDVPDLAQAVDIIVYAVPETQGLEGSTVLYDDFFLTNTPNISNRVFIVATDQQPQADIVRTTVRNNPTSYTLSLDNTPGYDETYLVLQESFHPKWEITSINDKATAGSLDIEHFSDSNGYNIWKITGLNTLDQDITVDIRFTPQRSFYIGSAISLLSLGASGSYAVYDNKRRKGPHVK